MVWNNFTAPNMGLLVYKRLYTEREILFLEDGNTSRLDYNAETNQLEIFVDKKAKTTPFDPFYKSVFDKTLSHYHQIENEAAANRFCLKTTYPGLLCGSGYTHDSNVKGDIKVGFYFDHTTGQPVIPGSSIKGVLKTIFENENDQTDESSLEAFRFIIKEIIEIEEDEIEKKKWKDIITVFETENSVKILELLKEGIFGKQEKEGNDVFFDAVIHIEKTGTSKKFLAADFITPHYPNLLQNPTPLMFMKVLPEITFEFRFKLLETTVSDNQENFTFKAANKERLFKQIILTLGLGAKTNVGYGQFQ